MVKIKRKREREMKKKLGGSERRYIFWVEGARNYLYNSSFEGSQAVPVHPSGIDKAYNRIFYYYYYYCIFL
jgi:hypothetical protein